MKTTFQAMFISSFCFPLFSLCPSSNVVAYGLSVIEARIKEGAKNLYESKLGPLEDYCDTMGDRYSAYKKCLTRCIYEKPLPEDMPVFMRLAFEIGIKTWGDTEITTTDFVFEEAFTTAVNNSRHTYNGPPSSGNILFSEEGTKDSAKCSYFEKTPTTKMVLLLSFTAKPKPQ